MFSAAGTVPINASWTIKKTGTENPTEGDVNINTLEKPERVIIDIKWQDCSNKNKFRKTQLKYFVEARVQWDASGAVVLDDAAGRWEEHFATDDSLDVIVRKVTFGAEVFVGKDVKKKFGSKDGQTWLLQDATSSREFRGKVKGETAALIMVSGKVFMTAKSAKGPAMVEEEKKKKVATFADGSFESKVSSIELIDETENIIVPDPD